MTFPGYELVRSNVLPGSMAVGHQQQIVSLCEVARAGGNYEVTMALVVELRGDMLCRLIGPGPSRKCRGTVATNVLR